MPSEKCCRRSSKNLLTLLPMLRELPGAPIHFYVCSIMAPSCWTLHSDIRHLIADGFLNPQIHMRQDAQPTLFALKNAL